ncbi:hypothetical protein ACLKA7_005494 [Drosophila subpalustris]
MRQSSLDGVTNMRWIPPVRPDVQNSPHGRSANPAQRRLRSHHGPFASSTLPQSDTHIGRWRFHTQRPPETATRRRNFSRRPARRNTQFGMGDISNSIHVNPTSGASTCPYSRRLTSCAFLGLLPSHAQSESRFFQLHCGTSMASPHCSCRQPHSHTAWTNHWTYRRRPPDAP